MFPGKQEGWREREAKRRESLKGRLGQEAETGQRLTWNLWLRGRASWGEGGGQSPGGGGRSVGVPRMPWEVCSCRGEAVRGHSCW